ncbi:MAG: beta-ketoacyl-ACP synthase III [Planctomycetota bacterium]
MNTADLDLILLATFTGDSPLPATACRLQHRLGVPDVPAMDINAGCSGFVYALTNATAFIRAGMYRNVLVVGVEVMSSVVDWTDRATCVLFGDGAGAVVLTGETPSGRGVLATHIGADGSGADDLQLPAGGSARRTSAATLAAGLHTVRMNGAAIFRSAVLRMADTVEAMLAAAQLTLDDLELLIPHQANHRIIEAVARRLQFPMDRVVTNLDRYGNTSAASIAIALDEARRDGVATAGDVVALVAFGAGLTWGGCLLRL